MLNDSPNRANNARLYGELDAKMIVRIDGRSLVLERKHFGKTYSLMLWLVGVWLVVAAPGVFAAAPLTISGAWIRLLPGNVPLAGYFTLHNHSHQPVQLIGASSPAFKRIGLHRSMTMRGMDKMVPVKRVKVAPGRGVKFAPGGYHLMMWRRRSLKIGERVPVTLRFAGGHHLRAVFIVKGPAGNK
jgi:copper(I)-binding protein